MIRNLDFDAWFKCNQAARKPARGLKTQPQSLVMFRARSRPGVR